MSTLAIKTFHAVGFAVYAYGIYYSEVYLDIPLRNPKHRMFGRYKYLTHWNLMLQGAMFTLFCIIDFAPLGLGEKRKLEKLRDHAFLTLSVPTCIFVSSFFWGLYIFDRELIFPKQLELYYPSWLNHLSHTVIIVFALIELRLYYHVQPNRNDGFMTVLGLVVSYTGWLMFLGLTYGIWVYPILEILSPVSLIIFVAVSCLVLFGCYIITEKLNQFFWTGVHGRAVSNGVRQRQE